MDRILIIDDDVFVRSGLAEDLRHGGFEVETAGARPDGLAALANTLPALVLLDVLLDKDDGIHVLEEIREKYPQLPVVMITGNASMKTALGALRTGATDYFLKPFEPLGLVNRVQRIIDARRDHVLAEQAERARDKLHSLQTLAGGIAHDLNNQLTVILGSAQEMVREPQQTADHQQLLAATLDSGEMVALLADFPPDLPAAGWDCPRPSV